jgi:hypothetical protein
LTAVDPGGADDMPGGERRSQPPASLDVIAYQVGALQSALDRSLGQLERTMERGFAEVKIEVVGLSNRMGDLEQQFVRMDERQTAVEKWIRAEEERQKEAATRATQRAEIAEENASQMKLLRWVGVVLVSLAAVGGFVVALLQLVGGP